MPKRPQLIKESLSRIWSRTVLEPRSLGKPPWTHSDYICGNAVLLARYSCQNFGLLQGKKRVGETVRMGAEVTKVLDAGAVRPPWPGKEMHHCLQCAKGQRSTEEMCRH